MDITENAVIEVTYPFIRTTYDSYDELEGTHAKLPTWQAGVGGMDFNGYSGTFRAFGANAEGQMILTIVSIHKPGKYPERIFYTRQYRDPDGKIYGKTNLKIMATRSLKRYFKWFGEPYEIVDRKLDKQFNY